MGLARDHLDPSQSTIHDGHAFKLIFALGNRCSPCFSSFVQHCMSCCTRNLPKEQELLADARGAVISTFWQLYLRVSSIRSTMVRPNLAVLSCHTRSFALTFRTLERLASSTCTPEINQIQPPTYLQRGPSQNPHSSHSHPHRWQ